jgi:hypothetical protein
MPDWLQSNLAQSGGLTLRDQLVRLALAGVLGILVAVIFRFSHGRRHDRADMLAATLVLLSMLIAMVSMVIGGSVALAFSLVGALSIVRFRTVVEDTRDTAFVIFAVVVGMAAGAGHARLAMIGTPAVGLVALLLSLHRTVAAGEPGLLTVRVGLRRDAGERLLPVLQSLQWNPQLLTVATTKQGSALELIYRVRVASVMEMPQAIAELNQQEGIQAVELTLES